jgi:hypothetical protein
MKSFGQKDISPEETQDKEKKMEKKTVDIYFALTEKTMNEQAISSVFVSNSQHFSWRLNANNVVSLCVTSKIEDLINIIWPELEKIKSFTICKSKISESDCIDGLRAAMVGDVCKTVDVEIFEMTYVNRTSPS